MSSSPPRSPHPPLLSPRPRPWASARHALDYPDSPQTVERMLGGGTEGSVWKGDWSEDDARGEGSGSDSPRPRRMEEDDARAWSESPPPRPPIVHGRNQHQQYPSSNASPPDPEPHPGTQPSPSYSSPPRTPDRARGHEQQRLSSSILTPSPPSSASGLRQDREQEEAISPNSAAAQHILETLARMSHDPSAIDTSVVTGDVPSGGLRRRNPTMTTLEERTEESEGGAHERMRSLDEEEGSVHSRAWQDRRKSPENPPYPPVLPPTPPFALGPLPSQVALPSSRPSSAILPTSTSLPILSSAPSSYPLPSSLSTSSFSSARPTSSPLPNPKLTTSPTLPPSHSTSDLIAMFERQKQDRVTPRTPTSTSTSPTRTSYLSPLPPSPSSASRSKSPPKRSTFDLSQFGTAASSTLSTFRPVLPSVKGRFPTKAERKDVFSDGTGSQTGSLMPVPLAPLPPPHTPSSALPPPIQSPPTPRARMSPLQKVVSAFASGASRPGGGGGGWEAASFGRRSGASWTAGGSGSGGLSIIKRARKGLRGRSRERSEASASAAAGADGGAPKGDARAMRDETSLHSGTVRLPGISPKETGRREWEEEKEDGDDAGSADKVETGDEEESEIEQPLRTGHLWYLNVHDPLLRPDELGRWIRCDARLYHSSLHLSWPTSLGRSSATIDLRYATEVRSMPSASHPDARDDLGTLAASQQDPFLAETLSPFLVKFADGVERLGTDTALERTRWVAAIWDVLAAHGSRDPRSTSTRSRTESSVASMRSQAQPSEVGSSNTHYQPPSFEPTFAILHDVPQLPPGTQGVDDSAVLYRDDGLLDPTLSREPSRRMGRGRAGMLRRVGSEADLELQAAASASGDARPSSEPSPSIESPLATPIVGPLPAVSTTDLPRTEDNVLSPGPPSYHTSSTHPASSQANFNLPHPLEHGRRERPETSRQESELSMRSARSEEVRNLDRSSSMGSELSVPTPLRDPASFGGGLSRSGGRRRQAPRVWSQTLSSPAPSSNGSSSGRDSRGGSGGAGGGGGGGGGRRGTSELTWSIDDLFFSATENTFNTFATAPVASSYATAPTHRSSSYATAPSASTYRSAPTSLASYATATESVVSSSSYLTPLADSSSHYSSLLKEATRTRPLPPSVTSSFSEHQVGGRQRPPSVPSSSSSSSSTIRSTAQESPQTSRHHSRVGTSVSSSLVSQRQRSVGSAPVALAGGILSDDINRLLRYLQHQDQQRIGREAVSAGQLERIEQGVLTLADPLDGTPRPPPVPPKGSPPSSSSSSSISDSASEGSSSTARPPARDLADIAQAQQAILAGQQEVNRLLAEDGRRREEERDHRVQEDEGRRVTLHRLDDLLRRVLWVLGDEVFHGDGGPPSEEESLYGPEVRSHHHPAASITEMSEEDAEEWNDDLSTYSSRPRRASISESNLPRAPAASLDENYFGLYGDIRTPRTERDRFSLSERSFDPSFNSLPSLYPPSERRAGPGTQINLEQLRERALPPPPSSSASSASTVRQQLNQEDLEDYERRRWEQEEEGRRRQQEEEERRRREEHEEDSRWETDEDERLRREQEERQRNRLALDEEEDEDPELTAQARRARRRPPRIQDTFDTSRRAPPLPEVLGLPSPVGNRRRPLPPLEPDYGRRLGAEPPRQRQNIYYDLPEPAQNTLAAVRPPITRNYWRRGAAMRANRDYPPNFIPRGYGPGGVGLYGGGLAPGYGRSGNPTNFIGPMGPGISRGGSPFGFGGASYGYGPGMGLGGTVGAGYAPGMGMGYAGGYGPGDRYEGDQGRGRRDDSSNRDWDDREHPRHRRDRSYSDDETDEDARRARQQANEVARGLNDVAAAVEDEHRSRQNEMHNLNDSIDNLRREVASGSVLGAHPTQFGTLLPQTTLSPGNLATTNDVQRIVEDANNRNHRSHSRRGSNSPPPVNVTFAAPPASYPTQSFPQPTFAVGQPTQVVPAPTPVVVVGGGGNNPPQETTRIIREEGGGGLGGGGGGGILSRLAEGVVPDATRRAENAAALGERRREDDMRRETEQRRGDQLRSEEANRRFLEQNRVSEQSRRDEEASRRNNDMLRATTAAATGAGALGVDRGASRDVQDAARTLERVADRVERAETRRPEAPLAVQQPTVVATRLAPQAFETVQSDAGNRIQPTVLAPQRRPESVQLRPADSVASNVASAPARPDTSSSNLASAQPTRTTASPAPSLGNTSSDIKERVKLTGPVSNLAGTVPIAVAGGEPTGFFRPSRNDPNLGTTSSSNVPSGAPAQASRPGILKPSATSESDPGDASRPAATTSSNVGNGAGPFSGFLNPLKNVSDTTKTTPSTSESDAGSRPPSRPDSVASTAPTTAPSTGSGGGAFLARPPARSTATTSGNVPPGVVALGDSGDGILSSNKLVRQDAPMGGRPRPVTTVPSLLGPGGDSTSKDATRITGSASGKGAEGSTAVLASGAPVPVSKDSIKTTIEGDAGGSRFPSILRKPVATTSNLQGIAPDGTARTTVAGGSGRPALPSRPSESTTAAGDGPGGSKLQAGKPSGVTVVEDGSIPASLLKPGNWIVPAKGKDSVFLSDGSSVPSAVVAPGGKLVRPSGPSGVLVPATGGEGPSMTLADGAGKTVSVPLGQPSGEASTRIQSKEEVKGEGLFNRPSANIPGETAKIKSDTKTGPFDRPSASGPSTMTLASKDGKTVTVPLGPQTAGGNTKVKANEEIKTFAAGGVPGRPGLVMPGGLGPPLADGSKAPLQPTLTVKDADGKVTQIPLGPKLVGAAAGKDVVMSNSDALKDLRKVLGDFKDGSDKTRKDDESWRKFKDDRDAKIMAALEKLVAEREGEKKALAVNAEEDKKKPPPTIQTLLDNSKTRKEEDDKRMKDALTEIQKQNAASQKAMVDEFKKTAREQVQYNVSGHLDNFSKSLAGEVKTLMKEVGDLRESKRALQHEIADLLLIKARHGGGDGLNLFPWQGAAKPAAAAAPGAKPPVTVPVVTAPRPAAPPALPKVAVPPAQTQPQWNPYAQYGYAAPPAPTTQAAQAFPSQPVWGPNGWQ